MGAGPALEENTALLGLGLVAVERDDNVALLAPDLVIHYVVDHNYKPPENFIAAVSCGNFIQPLKYSSVSELLQLMMNGVVGPPECGTGGRDGQK